MIIWDASAGEEHYPDGECDCHCPSCGEPREEEFKGVYATCGDCFGGRDGDGEAFRADEAEAYARWQQADIQRTLK